MTLAVVIACVTGCATGPVPDGAHDACRAVAASYDGNVAGTFITTVGGLRRFEGAPADQERWPEIPDARPAVMCFIDGDIRKVLGGGDNAFNRAVVGVVDGHGEMIMAGFQDRLPVRAP